MVNIAKSHCTVLDVELDKICDSGNVFLAFLGNEVFVFCQILTVSTGYKSHRNEIDTEDR